VQGLRLSWMGWGAVGRARLCFSSDMHKRARLGEPPLVSASPSSVRGEDLALRMMPEEEAHHHHHHHHHHHQDEDDDARHEKEDGDEDDEGDEEEVSLSAPSPPWGWIITHGIRGSRQTNTITTVAAATRKLQA